MRSEGALERGKAKGGMALAQQMSAQASERGVQGDIALADAMGKSSGGGKSGKGMSTGLKIGIAVGVVAILGLVGFMIYKKGKK